MAQYREGMPGIPGVGTGAEVPEQRGPGISLGNIAAGSFHRDLDYHFRHDGFLPAWKITFQSRQRSNTHWNRQAALCHSFTFIRTLFDTRNMGRTVEAYQRISSP